MAVTPIKPLTLAYTAMEEEKPRSGDAGPGPLRGRRPQAEDQVQFSAQARALARDEADPPAPARGRTARPAPDEADRPPARSLNLLA